MKKIFLIHTLLFLLISDAFAQVQVSDSKTIPFDLTLDQVLRVNVTSGGNIEFVFNTLSQYKNGIPNTPFYDTYVQVASSSNWELHLGAESDLTGTDDALNTINKNNVGFTVTWSGLNVCCAAANPVSSITGTYNNSTAGTANGLALFTGAAGDVLFTNGLGGTNGGDVADNKFIIHWECGTQGGGTTPMNPASLLGSKADRYVTTVFIELEALP